MGTLRQTATDNEGGIVDKPPEGRIVALAANRSHAVVL